MNGGVEGYCKWPGNVEIVEYINQMKILYSTTRCHTLDRDNI